MQDKKFFIILGSVTGVLVILCIVFAMSQSGEIQDKYLPARQKYVKDVKKLKPGKVPNQAIIDQLKNRKKSAQKQGTELQRAYVKPAVTRFEVPVIKGYCSFPYNSKIWSEKGIAQLFRNQYVKSQADYISQVKPVKLPLRRAIIVEAVRIQEQWNLQKRLKLQLEGKGKTTSRHGRDNTPADEQLKIAVDPVKDLGRPAPAKGEKPEKIAISPKALRQARDKLLLESVKTGNVYFDKKAILNHPVIGLQFVTQRDMAPDIAWRVLTDLWIQRDVLQAIKETNDDVFRFKHIPAADQNVLTAAIKKVISIQTEETDYALLGDIKNAFEQQAGQMPAANYGDSEGQEGQSKVKFIPASKFPKVTKEGTTTLTGWVNNQQFDVINYSVKMLMPTRYINLFQRKLSSLGYHVVIDQKYSDPSKGFTGQTPDAGAYANPNDTNFTTAQLTYTGTEPLREVTIRAQLLLPTSFSRGLAVEKGENKYSWKSVKFPGDANVYRLAPLMPKVVLKQITDKLPQAMRQSDKVYLEGKISYSSKLLKAKKPAKKSAK